MADRYAVGIGAGKTWTNADTSIWSASSGGASGASVPGVGDVAIFDANSGGSGAYVVSLNYSPTCDINFAGISVSVPLLIRSSVRGTARTITASSVTVADYVHFQDITAAGAGSWDISGVQSGDCGGNTGITFATPQTNYWVGSAGNCSDLTHWASSSGGSGSTGRVPLPQDAVIVDANSGTGAITQNMPRIGSWNFTGSSGIEWATTTVASWFGSINITDLSAASLSSQSYTYEGRGSSTFTSDGNTWAKLFTIDCVTGTLTLGDALSTTNGIDLNSGTFTDGSFSVTAQYFEVTGTATRALNMGTGNVWLLSRVGSNIWNAASTGLTLNPGTATIRLNGILSLAGTFAGGGLTYHRLENVTTGAFPVVITGSNTFNGGIYVDATSADRTLQFTAGTTTTVLGPGLQRDAGSNTVTLTSATAATHTLTHTSGPVINLHDMDISYSIATQTDTFYAGATPPSVDSGNNTNWIFTAAPSGGGNANTMIRAGGVVPS